MDKIVDTSEKSKIHIGIEGENQVTKVLFDVTKWNDPNRVPLLVPGGRYIVYVKKPGENEIVQHEIPLIKKKEIIKGEITYKYYALWSIELSDLEKPGNGGVQLYYKNDNGQVKASPIYDTVITKCL